MNKKVRELRQQRAKLIADGEALLAAADAENRNLTEEETSQYETWMAEIDSLATEIERRERQARLSAEIVAPAGRSITHEAPPSPLIGMSPDEVKKYNLLRAINAAATRNWNDAVLEQEASMAVAEQLGNLGVHC